MGMQGWKVQLLLLLGEFVVSNHMLILETS